MSSDRILGAWIFPRHRIFQDSQTKYLESLSTIELFVSVHLKILGPARLGVVYDGDQMVSSITKFDHWRLTNGSQVYAFGRRLVVQNDFWEIAMAW